MTVSRMKVKTKTTITQFKSNTPFFWGGGGGGGAGGLHPLDAFKKHKTFYNLITIALL